MKTCSNCFKNYNKEYENEFDLGFAKIYQSQCPYCQCPIETKINDEIVEPYLFEDDLRDENVKHEDCEDGECEVCQYCSNAKCPVCGAHVCCGGCI